MFDVYLRCKENGKLIGLWTEEGGMYTTPQVVELSNKEQQVGGYYNKEYAELALSEMIRTNQFLHDLGAVRDFTFEIVRATIVVSYEVL